MGFQWLGLRLRVFQFWGATGLNDPESKPKTDLVWRLKIGLSSPALEVSITNFKKHFIG